ncbi:hypothetical protein WH87_04780 [Devosia epidermidihirudinis]|uniref:Uncharacterized protein n=1 Tax=Devosia epidermidihirudinis TaxID=1293439 RepID=A0A0F5QFL6_9HYPH|nr:hypothetical protein [Devosia epidermidihirudinis]KKC39513.1 hypothetical protein WH87_04780 [Devosia epidermidihirudinis]
MALKSVYTSGDDIPAEHKGLYEEQGDVFVLSIEDIDSHPKVRGVITANRENVKKRDEYKARAAELEARIAEIPEGFDADEYLALKASAGDPDDPNKKKIADEHIQSQKALYETRIANLTKKHGDELSARDQAIAERDGYIDRTVAEAGLKDSLLAVGVDPELLDGALAYLKPSVKVQRTDDGNRKAIVETDLGEIAVPDFVKDWAQSKGRAFLAKPSGPAAEGNNGSGRGAKLPSGNFGGDKGERTKAIASKFPELAQ